MADEEVLNKTGVELFRELLRVYPVAELDDYYKGNVWRNDVMKVDLQLIEAHRKEAGAPDPPPLEEVKVPELPKAPPGFAGLVLPGAVRPVLPGAIAPRPAGVVGAVTLAMAGGAAAVAGGPVAELRLIALFVAKWKLDPSKTKMMLAKVTAPRRKYIIQNFKGTGEAAEVTNSLEQYIAECEKTGDWDKAAATPAATLAATTGTAAVVVPPGARPVAPRPAINNGAATLANSGVKRPLTPVSVGAVIDPAKRPRIGPMGGVTPATNAGNAWGGATGNSWGQQQTPVVRPPPNAGARPVAPRAVAPRPVGMTPVRPAAKAQEKPGELIRNLLQRF